MTLLTTESVSERDRFAYWRDVITQHFVHLRPELTREGSFRGEIRAEKIAGLSVSQVASGGQRVHRGRPEIARSPVPIYFFNVQVAGTGSFRQGREEIALEPGDMFVVDALREFELGCEKPFRHLSVKLPRELVDGRVARPDLVPGAVIRRDHPLCGLAVNYLLNAFASAESLSASTATMVGEHAVELLTQALVEAAPKQPLPGEAWRAALFAAARRIMRIRFGDANLGPDHIARQLGVSTRLLHRVFAEHGETVMRSLLEYRISRSAQLLTARDAAHRSITDIAFACGFNDSSHFGRAFAAHTGMTPSQWRRQNHA